MQLANREKQHERHRELHGLQHHPKDEPTAQSERIGVVQQSRDQLAQLA